MTVIMKDNNDPANILLQRCVPILEEKIRIMHNDLSSKLNDHLTTQETTNDYITRLITGQASINLSVNLPDLQNGQSHISATTKPQQNLMSNSNPPPPTLSSSSSNSLEVTEKVPHYQMSRGIVSIKDLWREWKHGLCGGYAVQDLEEKFGTRWRRAEKEKKFFNRRKLIIKTIEDYAMKRNISLETAVNIAERRRSQKGYSLHWLANNKIEIFGVNNGSL